MRDQRHHVRVCAAGDLLSAVAVREPAGAVDVRVAAAREVGVRQSLLQDIEWERPGLFHGLVGQPGGTLALPGQGDVAEPDRRRIGQGQERDEHDPHGDHQLDQGEAGFPAQAGPDPPEERDCQTSHPSFSL